MDYELIVIGAGTAGSNVAKAGVRMGAKVAIVEKDGFGGCCLERG